VPFASGWERVTRFQRDVFFIAFLCTAAATMLLIAPSAYHRLRWKDDDLKGLLEIANRLTIAGISFLALGMTAVVLLITDLLFSSGPAIVVTGVVALGFGWFWYGLALRGRARG
jgi:hypothetical protein